MREGPSSDLAQHRALFIKGVQKMFLEDEERKVIPSQYLGESKLYSECVRLESTSQRGTHIADGLIQELRPKWAPRWQCTILNFRYLVNAKKLMCNV